MRDEPGEPSEEVPALERGKAAGRGILIRRADGEWETLDPQPRNTGDPELDALWGTSLDELERILEDPEDPRYDKAQQVTKEILQPLRRAIDVMLEPITERLQEAAQRMAGNLIPPQALRPNNEAWLKAIQPLNVPPQPNVDVYDIGADTTAENVANVARRVADAIEAQRESDREAREQERADRLEDRAEGRRNHRTMLGWTIAGVGIAVLAIVCSFVVPGVLASRPDRTDPVACGQIPSSWRAYIAVSALYGRTDSQSVAARRVMFDRWATAMSDAPSWTVEVMKSARDALTSATSGAGTSADAEASYSAAGTYLTTFVEECQSEGNLPDSYTLD